MLERRCYNLVSPGGIMGLANWLTTLRILLIPVLVTHVAGGTVHPAPSWLGKLSTVCQMATVLAAMVTFYFRILPGMPAVFAWVTAAVTVGSGLQYIVQGLKQI